MNYDGSWLYGGSDGQVHIKPAPERKLTLPDALFLLEVCRIQLLKSADILPYNYPKN
jgi:hypothetical protein